MPQAMAPSDRVSTPVSSRPADWVDKLVARGEGPPSDCLGAPLPLFSPVSLVAWGGRWREFQATSFARSWSRERSWQ